MTTFERVQEVIADQLGVDKAQITEDSHLINDLDADSIEIAEMLFLLMDEFNINIEQEDVEKLGTPKDVVQLIDSLVK